MFNIKKTKKDKGLTIIETVVAISMFAVISATVASSVIYFYRANSYSIEQAFAVNNARRGIEFMVRDIREATYSDEGSFPIISASTISFYFYSDIDRDNNVERVRFFLEDGSLKKGVTKPDGEPLTYNDGDEQISIVSENVRNVSQGMNMLTYFDDTGVELVDLSDVTNISFVRISLIVNINPDRLPNEFTLRSSATMRNLKDNF